MKQTRKRILTARFLGIFFRVVMKLFLLKTDSELLIFFVQIMTQSH